MTKFFKEAEADLNKTSAVCLVELCNCDQVLQGGCSFFFIYFFNLLLFFLNIFFCNGCKDTLIAYKLI